MNTAVKNRAEEITDKDALLKACREWLLMREEIAKLQRRADTLAGAIIAATNVDEGGQVDCYWPLIVGENRIHRVAGGRLEVKKCERLD